MDRGALRRLIDHAPLFPPASMTLDDALAEDRAARESDYAWLLDRFVCPASRLEELGEPTMPLSVVLDAPLSVRVTSLEVPLSEPRPDSRELLRTAHELRSFTHEVYYELVLGERWRDTVPAAIGAIAAVGGRVKLRCGEELAPSSEQVALVLASCRQAGVAMKATGGLQRPLRHGEEHGFLNLLCAAVLAHARRAQAGELEQVLSEERLEDLPLGEFDAEEILGARQRLFKGFGSGSWREPVDGLRALGLIE